VLFSSLAALGPAHWYGMGWDGMGWDGMGWDPWPWQTAGVVAVGHSGVTTSSALVGGHRSLHS